MGRAARKSLSPPSPPPAFDLRTWSSPSTSEAQHDFNYAINHRIDMLNFPA